MQIIVADDDLSQRVHMSAMLTRYGFSTVAVATGEAALSTLQTSGASVLICDVQMPGMDGMELTRRVRALDLKRYVYVLMVTGLNESVDLMRGLEAGADDFMTKPVDTPVLLSRLRAARRLVEYEQRLQAKRSELESVNRVIQDDLEAAAQAQRMLLPPADLKLNGCRYGSSFLASSSISGDVFGYFALGPKRSGFFAADVSGHGVRAALSAVALGYMVSEEFFRNMAIGGEDEAPHPERVAQVLDRRFSSKLLDDTYFTLFAGVVDEAHDQMVFCQAGYPSALRVRGDSVQTIGTGGMPVALVTGAVFESASAEFVPGDRLLLLSDGVWEAESPAGKFYGAQRLSAFLTQSSNLLGSDLLPALNAEIHAWTGSELLADDISAIVIDRET